MPTRLLGSTSLLNRDGERLADSVIEPFSLRFAGYVGEDIRTLSRSVAPPMPQAGAVQTDVPPAQLGPGRPPAHSSTSNCDQLSTT
jgi:hypothetical protein